MKEKEELEIQAAVKKNESLKGSAAVNEEEEEDDSDFDNWQGVSR